MRLGSIQETETETSDGNNNLGDKEHLSKYKKPKN